ncbi:MAG: phage tail protein [Kiritimatiellia bacterium]
MAITTTIPTYTGSDPNRAQDVDTFNAAVSDSLSYWLGISAKINAFAGEANTLATTVTAAETTLTDAVALVQEVSDSVADVDAAVVSSAASAAAAQSLIDGLSADDQDVITYLRYVLKQLPMMPVGQIIPFPIDKAPSDRWYECNGGSVLKTAEPKLYAYLAGSFGEDTLNFTLPDYRGEVLRGWDHGRGVDLTSAIRGDRGDGTTGDYPGTTQDCAVQAHIHNLSGVLKSEGSGGHSHTIDPPTTYTNTTGSHTHGFRVQTGPAGSNGIDLESFGNETWQTDAAGNHNHYVDIPAFTSGTVNAHTHTINVEMITSSYGSAPETVVRNTSVVFYIYAGELYDGETPSLAVQTAQVKTEDFTASCYSAPYIIDTEIAAVEVTLPANPPVGGRVELMDKNGFDHAATVVGMVDGVTYDATTPMALSGNIDMMLTYMGQDGQGIELGWRSS